MSEDLKDKMYSYEVTPPATAWDKIAQSLDDSALSHEFPSTLYNIEIAPPKGAWNNIAALLNADLPVEQPKRAIIIPSFIRFAAAAAVVGVIAYGAIKYFKPAVDKTQIADNNRFVPKEIEPTITPDTIKTVDQTDDQPVTGQLTTSIIPQQQKQISSTTTGNSVRIRMHNDVLSFAQAMNFAKVVISDVADGFNNVHIVASAYDIAHNSIQNDIANRYIMLMTPDGNVIRMSKKLSTLVCCVSGEDQDEGCKDQLQRWREKIAASSATSSPANFMDILTLVNSLQDGKL